MNARPKAVAGSLLGWCLIACFVVLLTLIFSFLGTFICAALAGMMMGAAGLKKWHSLAMSLLFPAVIISVMKISRAELGAKEVGLLSLLCFSLFWLVYLAVFVVVSQEQAARPKKSRPASNPTAPPGSLPSESNAPPGAMVARVATALPELTLVHLQGQWLSQPPGAGSRACRRLIEIHDDTLVLSEVAEDGHTDLLGKAELRCCRSSLCLLSAKTALKPAESRGGA